jgi:hypothetical protein
MSGDPNYPYSYSISIWMLNRHIRIWFCLSGLRFVFDKTAKYPILFVSERKKYSMKLFKTYFYY